VENSKKTLELCENRGKNPEQQQNIHNTGAKNGNVEPFTLIKNKIEVNALSVKLDPQQK